MESILERQVEAYLHPRSRPGLNLHFPKELEARFERDTLDRRSRQVIFTALTATLFYDLFLIADYAQHPEVIWRCVLLRLGVVTPVILVTIWSAHRRVKTALRETLILLSVALASGCVLAISYNLNRIDSLFSQTGFILIVFFGILVLRQQFAYAVATLVIMLCEDVAFLATDHWMTMQDKVAGLLTATTCILLTLLANYMMERQERIGFAHFLKEGFNSKALQQLNQKLTALSQVDGLTGLSNRRHFEQRFEELWLESIDRNQAISLLLIDIDHFKRLNDTFGHIAGDRVLIKMGQVLASSVRGSEDVVARFGGEEFILLLAGADHEAAHQVAEDLRILVCTTPMMPLDGRQSPVTISCGLATVFPTASLNREEDRLSLIATADLALYAAKGGGRNCVFCRTCKTTLIESRWNSAASMADA